MASLPMDFHMKGLVETLKLGDRMDDVIETMIVLYEREDTGMFWPLFRAVLPSSEDDEAGYAAFEETMITSRNRTMADACRPDARPAATPSSPSVRCICLAPKGWSSCSGTQATRSPPSTEPITQSVTCERAALCYPLPVETMRRKSWMTKVLIVAASLSLTLSAAGACDFTQSAEAELDQTVVASVVADEQKAMSIPELILLEDAVPAPTEEVAE